MTIITSQQSLSFYLLWTISHHHTFLMPQRLWNHRPRKSLLLTVGWHCTDMFLLFRHTSHTDITRARSYAAIWSSFSFQVKDYLCDTPLFLLLLVRWLGNMDGLVWLFLLRVAVCGFGAAMSLASPLETLPGPLSSVLSTLDDFVVVFLLLISIVNINQQMGPQRTGTRTVTQGVLTDAL